MDEEDAGVAPSLHKCESEEPLEALCEEAAGASVRPHGALSGADPVESAWENHGLVRCGCDLPQCCHHHVKDCEEVLVDDVFPCDEELVKEELAAEDDHGEPETDVEGCVPEAASLDVFRTVSVKVLQTAQLGPFVCLVCQLVELANFSLVHGITVDGEHDRRGKDEWCSDRVPHNGILPQSRPLVHWQFDLINLLSLN